MFPWNLKFPINSYVLLSRSSIFYANRPKCPHIYEQHERTFNKISARNAT